MDDASHHVRAMGEGMPIDAEGNRSLATPGQAAYLQAAGCDEAQGYLYAKPMAASRMAHFIGGWDASAVLSDRAGTRLMGVAS